MTVPAARPSVVIPEVLAEDRFLWQFWINKGMKPEPLALSMAALTAPGAFTNWDYIAGNALYGGFEEDVLRALRTAPAGPGGARGGVPSDFLERFARDVTGSRRPVTPGTPEGRLLVLCASPRMTTSDEAEAAALAAGRLEWEALVAAAARGNLTAAVQHNLSRLELDTKMPRALADVLSARARGIAARNGRLVQLVNEMVAVLGGEAIRPLLLKESALAFSHYGNGRLRMMGDIDLLMQADEIDRVVALLEARGYESAEVLWTKRHYKESHHHAAPLVRADLAVKIEPHHAIALPGLPADRTMSTADLVSTMASRAVRLDAKSWCFTPADTLLHLCLDLFGGAFLGKVGQACDAREVVRQGGVDWPLLESTAASIAAQAHLAFSLRLLADLDAPVPPEVISRLAAARRAPFDARRLRRIAERNLFGYVRSRAKLSREGEKLVFSTLMQPGGLLGRVSFLFRTYFYVGRTDQEVGELARSARPSTGQAVGRMLTLPWRVFRRWTSSRRMP
ncbi:MAG TPA: nucleotidyltransferase family protein [Patescibacteria group bacterium]|nr:nucleotidyltransferase family protein [Patescibacteria group bacterium]